MEWGKNGQEDARLFLVQRQENAGSSWRMQGMQDSQADSHPESAEPRNSAQCRHFLTAGKHQDSQCACYGAPGRPG